MTSVTGRRSGSGRNSASWGGRRAGRWRERERERKRNRESGGVRSGDAGGYRRNDKGRKDGGREAQGETFRVPKLNIDINKQIMAQASCAS